MGKFSYRIISFVMGICLAVSMSGCAGKAGQDKEKGTYIEKGVWRGYLENIMIELIILKLYRNGPNMCYYF